MIPTKPYAATDLGIFKFVDGKLMVYLMELTIEAYVGRSWKQKIWNLRSAVTTGKRRIGRTPILSRSIRFPRWNGTRAGGLFQQPIWPSLIKMRRLRHPRNTVPVPGIM